MLNLLIRDERWNFPSKVTELTLLSGWMAWHKVQQIADRDLTNLKMLNSQVPTI